MACRSTNYDVKWQIPENISHPHVRFEGTEGWVQANYNDRSLKSEPESILQTPLGPDPERFTNDETANRLLSRTLRSPWHL